MYYGFEVHPRGFAFTPVHIRASQVRFMFVSISALLEQRPDSPVTFLAVYNITPPSLTSQREKPAGDFPPPAPRHTCRHSSSQALPMARISRAASATALMLSTLVRPLPASAFLVRSPLTRTPSFSNLSRAALQAGKGFGDTPKPKQPQEPAKDKAPRKVCSCHVRLEV